MNREEYYKYAMSPAKKRRKFIDKMFTQRRGWQSLYMHIIHFLHIPSPVRRRARKDYNYIGENYREIVKSRFTYQDLSEKRIIYKDSKGRFYLSIRRTDENLIRDVRLAAVKAVADHYNKSHAARLLGISRETIRRLTKEKK